MGTSGQPDEWTDTKNNRRCELIDREVDGDITQEEAAELEQLQAEMLRYRQRVAPLPLEEARRIIEELERKARQAQHKQSEVVG